MPDSSVPTRGWYRDPSGVHEFRYFESDWTQYVSSGGRITTVPFQAPPRSQSDRPATSSRRRRVRILLVSIFVVLLAAVAIAVLANRTSGANREGLSGRWTSDDYTCPINIFHHESIDVVQRGTRVTATKVAGDDCVRSGHVTFTGQVTGDTGVVSFWTSQPGGDPTLGLLNQQLRVTGSDTFTVQFAGVGTMVFTRATGSTHASRWWVIWLVAGALVSGLIGYLVGHARGRRQCAAH